MFTIFTKMDLSTRLFVEFYLQNGHSFLGFDVDLCEWTMNSFSKCGNLLQKIIKTFLYQMWAVQ